MKTAPPKSISSADTARKIKELLKEGHEEKADAVRLDELRQLLGQLVSDGELVFGQQAPKNAVAAKWHAYLKKSHKSMVSQLCERISSRKRTALRCMMGVVASSPLRSTNNKYEHINDELLNQCVKSITDIKGDLDKSLRHMLEAEFIRPYRDVQYYMLGVIKKIANAEYDTIQEHGGSFDGEDEHAALTNVTSKLVQILLMIPLPKSEEDMAQSKFLFTPADGVEPDRKGGSARKAWSDDEDTDDDDNDLGMHTDDEDSDDDGNDDDDEDQESKKRKRKRPKKKRRLLDKSYVRKFSFQDYSSFRSEYQKAWLTLLKLPLQTSDLKKVLRFLPSEVLAIVPKPLRFSDFFMSAYADEEAGIVGVLALEGIFLLVTKHGLEYPEFYKQLYRLITPRIMFAKYRIRFFDLLTKCLAKNNMLPAHVVAAFCKRLCRCALSSPPPAILFCLALVSNLIRVHRECACLINRSRSDEMTDGYDAAEEDPVKSHALQSSLWEVCVLEKHYIPAIQTLARGLGSVEESKMPLYIMEDFLDHSYKSLFDQEKKKRMKTALAFKKPTSLFTNEDMFANFLETSTK
mmetsp:Transcript_12703/g.36959  ORF Transcript_12703/g.36959 Transcript_12703/m.36959 type:complete len:576 (+) Transcript_12703:31-1758(+)